jgi:hypothetical protein
MNEPLPYPPVFMGPLCEMIAALYVYHSPLFDSFFWSYLRITSVFRKQKRELCL